jgi:NAD(P)-dependent dehydrogenase (short-subunit alcohol dehydrogenase family)
MDGCGRLVGTRAVVAEGTTAIGCAVVTCLRDEGAEVAFGSRAAGSANPIAAATGATPIARGGDDSAFAQAAVTALGSVNALVVACGQPAARPLGCTPDGLWDEILESDVLEPWRLVSACAPELGQHGGAVVVISSAADAWPSAAVGAHSVAAHALVSLASMLAVELADSGVRVNTICPELAMPTPHDSDELDDIARAVAFLLSADARGCTATTLVLDHGRRASLTAGLAVAT